MSLTMLVNASYLVAATLFLLGLQRMASPATARTTSPTAWRSTCGTELHRVVLFIRMYFFALAPGEPKWQEFSKHTTYAASTDAT